MRIYEEMFIVRPEVTEEELTPFVDQVKNVITSAGGTVDKADDMGVRRLAYPVEKKNEGHFYLLQFTAAPNIVHEVERRMRVTDIVMKFITVRIDEKLKRAEKLRKQKEARAKRKPIQPVAAPERPSVEQMMAEMPGRPAPSEEGA